MLMTANTPETALYKAPIISFLLASHGKLVHMCMCEYVAVDVCMYSSLVLYCCTACTSKNIAIME